ATGAPCLVTLPRIWQQRDLSVAVQDAAICLFLQWLDSPARTRLFRCDGCGTYFIRTRTPKRDTPIYHGTFCAACKSKGKDRARRTEDSRNNRTEEMIG